MGRRKAPLEIGYRTQQEVGRLYSTDKDALLAIGCSKNMIWEWGQGIAPTAIYLARLHELGADIIWILTGRKGKTMDNYTATEEAYKNGKERMREAVIDKLKYMKGKAMGSERRTLDEAIRIIQKLEVI